MILLAAASATPLQHDSFLLPCRLAFMRDVAAYLIASAVTLALLWDGAFARYEAIVLILLYVLYLSICVYTSRCASQVPESHRTRACQICILFMHMLD